MRFCLGAVQLSRRAFGNQVVLRQPVLQQLKRRFHPFAKMSVTVIGGSTQKLTTQQKKQEAVQVGQVMAQYVKAAPASALKVSLTMLSKAFDDFMISEEDWDKIEQEVAMMAQSQQGGAPGQAPPGAPPGAAPPQPAPPPGAGQ